MSDEFQGRDLRTDDKMRELIGRVADAAAEKAAAHGAELALRRFGDLTIHDISTKEGRTELSEDLRHSHAWRKGIERARATIAKTVIGAAALGVCYAVWNIVKPLANVVK